MKFELGERETTITYDTDTQTVRIFSAIAKDQRKLQKAGLTPCNKTKFRGFFYELPLERFKWRVSSGLKRVLSPKTLAKMKVLHLKNGKTRGL